MGRIKNFKERVGILKEFFEFIMKQKVWWLAPIIILLVLFSLFIIFTESTALAPFIYAIF